MDFLIKGSVIGVIASVLGLLLKKNAPEFALLLTVSAAAAIIGFALSILGNIKDFVYELAERGAISSALLMPLVKCVGISVCAKADCASRENTIAAQRRRLKVDFAKPLKNFI